MSAAGVAWSVTHSDDDDIIFSNTKQRNIPNPQFRCGRASIVGEKSRGNSLALIKGESNLWIDVNKSFLSWIDDDTIFVDAMFPENFRCLISGPSECGKISILKLLFLNNIQFDRLYIIGHNGNHYDDLKYKDIMFIKDIKQLVPPEELPEDIKKLMIFDDVEPREPIIRKHFCRGRHNNCNMIYLNQNLFSLDRQGDRENCNMFVLFEHRGNVLHRLYNEFDTITTNVWEEPHNYLVFDLS